MYTPTINLIFRFWKILISGHIARDSQVTTESGQCTVRDILPVENSMRMFVNDCRKAGMMRKDAVEKLTEIYQLDSEEAEKAMAIYWK